MIILLWAYLGKRNLYLPISLPLDPKETLEEAFDALQNGKTDGFLLDAYVAGSGVNNFFKTPFRVNKVIDTTKGLGVVLAGEAVVLRYRVRDFVKKNAKKITEIIQKSTSPLQVSNFKTNWTMYRADYNNPELLWFYFTVHALWLVLKKLVPPSQPSLHQPNHDLVTRVFPRLAPVTCMFASSSHCFVVLLSFVVIGHCNCFGFTWFYVENRSKRA